MNAEAVFDLVKAAEAVVKTANLGHGWGYGRFSEIPKPMIAALAEAAAAVRPSFPPDPPSATDPTMERAWHQQCC